MTITLESLQALFDELSEAPATETEDEEVSRRINEYAQTTEGSHVGVEAATLSLLGRQEQLHDTTHGVEELTEDEDDVNDDQGKSDVLLRCRGRRSACGVTGGDQRGSRCLCVARDYG